MLWSRRSLQLGRWKMSWPTKKTLRGKRRATSRHHHISVALACFAFVAAERARRFPPSAVRAQEDGALAVAA
jgi:hypothetical protein